MEFGCNAPRTRSCDHEASPGPTTPGPMLRLGIREPSDSWVAWLNQALETEGATHALLITLEYGDTWAKQKGLLDKSVELGTGYTVQLSKFTDVEIPVRFLQLTGVLLDRNGRVMGQGAEGLLAKQTGLLVTALGAHESFVAEDLQTFLNARRKELPGKPLVWQQALETLVRTLLEGGSARGPAGNAQPLSTS